MSAAVATAIYSLRVLNNIVVLVCFSHCKKNYKRPPIC